MSLESNEVFRRVWIDYLQSGGGRISWELQPSFRAPGPYYFQLQVSPTGGDPTQWRAVGEPQRDVLLLTDPEQRQFGQRPWVVYRVELTDAQTTRYYSPPVGPWGLLTERQWLLARAIVRRALQIVRRPSLNTLSGKLLKRKHAGTRCTCVDAYTGSSLNTDHAPCYGTGFVGGYWQAISTHLLDKAPAQLDVRLSEAQGTVAQHVVGGRFVGVPFITTGDIWVADHLDYRYRIHSVKNAVEFNQFPVIVEAELRLIPFGDISYKIPVN